MNELTVVTKSKELVHIVYKISRCLPKNEQFIIIPQIIRAAISVPSNIVEGAARGGRDFIRFIKISRGSLNELKVQLEIIEGEYKDLILIDSAGRVNDCLLSDAYELIDEIGRMSYNLILKLKTQTQK